MIEAGGMVLGILGLREREQNDVCFPDEIDLRSCGAVNGNQLGRIDLFQNLSQHFAEAPEVSDQIVSGDSVGDLRVDRSYHEERIQSVVEHPNRGMLARLSMKIALIADKQQGVIFILQYVVFFQQPMDFTFSCRVNGDYPWCVSLGQDFANDFVEVIAGSDKFFCRDRKIEARVLRNYGEVVIACIVAHSSHDPTGYLDSSTLMSANIDESVRNFHN